MSEILLNFFPAETRFPQSRSRLRIFAYRLYKSASACQESLGGAQFDSFSLYQGPPPEQELHEWVYSIKLVRVHEWSQSSLHIYGWRVPGASRNRLPSVKKANFVAREYGGATLRFTAPLLGQEPALHDKFMFICLGSQIGPPGEAIENDFNAACGFIPLY